MKRLLTIALAAATAISVSALDIVPAGTPLTAKKQQRSTSVGKTATPLRSAPSRAADFTIDELEGYWLMEYTDWSPAGDGDDYADVITIKATGDNTVSVSGLLGVDQCMTATVDCDAATISFLPQTYAHIEEDDQEFDLAVKHYHWINDYANYEHLDTPIVGKIDIAGNVIRFDYDDIFVIVAMDGDQERGLVAFIDNVYISRYEEPTDPYEPYVPVEGMAKFQDGWIFPSLGDDEPSTHIMEVALERSTVNPGVFRLVDPYSDPVYAERNLGDGKGYIAFDISDPEYVPIFADIHSGYAESDGKYYMYNAEGYLPAMYDYWGEFISRDEVLELMEIRNIPRTTYVDGVLTCEKSVFGTWGDRYGSYYWPGKNTTTVIALPEGLQGGIDSAIADGIAAPVEYFNLQGQKVAHPAAGLYIRRQGSTATKVFVK